MWLLISGWKYRQIALAVGLRSPQSVGNIAERELRQANGARRLMTEVGPAIFVERTEALLSAHRPAALAGDHRWSESCLDVLEQQARFYGLVTGPA
jgi:hypothetical protein